MTAANPVHGRGHFVEDPFQTFICTDEFMPGEQACTTVDVGTAVTTQIWRLMNDNERKKLAASHGCPNSHSKQAMIGDPGNQPNQSEWNDGCK